LVAKQLHKSASDVAGAADHQGGDESFGSPLSGGSLAAFLYDRLMLAKK
jgi:hypothetical protein